MTILVATNGSESAIGAARRCIDLLRPDTYVEPVTVVPEYEDRQDDAGALRAQ